MADTHFYRLELDERLEAFRPEIEYVFDFVDEHYPIRRHPDAERVLRYGTDIPARLFPDSVCVGTDGIRLNRDRFASLSDFWPSSSGKRTIGYDAVGVIFFMLSRLEERESDRCDRHDRFDAAASAAVGAGLHADPVADIAAQDLADWIVGDSVSPTGRFECVPTHDVDRLKGYHRWWEPLRYAAGDIVRRGKPFGAVRRFGAYFDGEPFLSFRDLLDVSERFGLTSRFYLIGPSHNRMDSPYAAIMGDLLKRVMGEVLDRGHIVGFHPGYATLRDAGEWRRQRHGLEALLGVRLREGRQHVLRYDAVDTPVLWDREGMAEDFTLAFAGPCGFRNGTTRSHRAFDLDRRVPLSLRQTATAVMDFALFDTRYRQLTVDEALAEAGKVADAAKRYHGRLVILHHTGQATGPAREFYGRFLEHVL